MKKAITLFVSTLLIFSMSLPFKLASAEPLQENRLSKADRILTILAEQQMLKTTWQEPSEGEFVEGWGELNGRSAEDAEEQAYIKASNTDAYDQFGYSVAVSENTLVIGAPMEDSDSDLINVGQEDNSAGNAGAAYVFVRSENEWAFQAYLKASNSDFGDYFGYSVAISGDTIVVGTPYEDSSTTTVNGNQDDNSLEEAGAAFVFVREGETWTQQAYLKPHNTGSHDNFGRAVDISGDTIVVGANMEDGDSDNSENSGAAYVFFRDEGTWSQEAYLKASDADDNDNFGFSVAISGNTIVVGALYALYGGAGYVFIRNEGAWSEQTQLIASNWGSGDFFGISVDISGDTIVVGAHHEDSNATGVDGDESDNTAGNSGAAYVFSRDDTTWSQEAYLKASNTGEGDLFGYSVAISGSTIAVGAYDEDSNAVGVNGNENDDSALLSGAVYAFIYVNGAWSQKAYLKASNTGAGDYFGQAVGLSLSNLVVGAYLEDSSATGVGGDGSNNDALDSGAGYAFEIKMGGFVFLPLIIK